MITDLEELENLDSSEIQSGRLNAKKVLTPKSEAEFVFTSADRSVTLAGRDQKFRTSTLIQDHPARGEEHDEVLQRETNGSQPSNQQTYGIEARHDFLRKDHVSLPVFSTAERNSLLKSS